MTMISHEGAQTAATNPPTGEYLARLDIVALSVIVVMSLGPLMTAFTLRVFS